ncbi:MAG: phosphodiester glycosidase family protein [Pseudomonadota bacterium]
MWWLAFVLAFCGAGAFAGCRDMAFEGASYTVCEVTAADDLRLFHSGPDGIFGSFSAVDQALEPQGLRLDFAMNAGMYHRDLAPVGLYVEDGVQVAPLVTRAGPGNFGLVPNGVFCVGDRLRVIETLTFEAEKPSCRYATQSGPMLVIGGKLHPKFLADSDSLNIRNGVGVSADGSRAVFAISNDQVNFYAFARLFRDGLGLPDALYFDGSISRLYDHDSGRHDAGFPMGPMVGVVVPR